MGTSNRPSFPALAAFIVSLIIAAPLSAAETNTCPMQVIPAGCAKCTGKYRMYADTQMIVFGEEDKRGSAVIKSDKCWIGFGYEHGSRGFGCKDIQVQKTYDRAHHATEWSASTGNEGGMAISRFDSDSKKGVILPKHLSLRRKFLVTGIDQEGWHQTYPLDYAYFVDFYPRKFIKIGPIRKVKNDWFETAQQTVVYKTMKGELRSAVTGQAKLDCLKINFITWQYKAETPEAEKLMDTLLSDIRLEYLRRE